MNREEALNLLNQNIKNQNLKKHCLAVEAGMKGLAKYFNENEGKWEICGLLHDIDYEKVNGDPNLHSKVGREMLRNSGLEEEIYDAIFSHNEIHGIEPKTKMAKSLFCLDPLTGLIVASTLVLPSKNINDLKVENVLHRFKEKSFARGANREMIKKCKENLGLSLEKFIEISLKAMPDIPEQLGL